MTAKQGIMNDYIEARIDLGPCCETYTDVLAAMLCECGYESFVPDDKGLTAYIKEADFDAEALSRVVNELPFENVLSRIDWKRIDGQDWNEEWEKNYFQPIVIDDECVIHSTFHKDVPQAAYEIVIDPKMAFGTGHHQTTTLMIRRLLQLPLKGATLTDVGTGTGILAILGAMRGATTVNAIEIDEFAAVNARENVALNGHPEVNIIHGDASALAALPKADFLLANINRNIILADLAAYVDAVKPEGLLVFSGFYKADALDIIDLGVKLGLSYEASAVLDDWTSLVMKKSE